MADAESSEVNSQLEILDDVLLTPEQTAQLKDDTGIDITRIVIQRVSRQLARDIHPSTIAITRLTWCW
jgi:hypothetical protein